MAPVDWSEALELVRANGETLRADAEAEQREAARVVRWAALAPLLEQLRGLAAGKAVAL